MTAEKTKLIEYMIDGGWQAAQEDDDTWKVMSEDYGRIVTLHAASGVEAQRESIEPLAKFIAAGPDMYAVLQLALTRLELIDDRDDACLRMEIRATLAKATA